MKCIIGTEFLKKSELFAQNYDRSGAGTIR